MIAAVKRFGVLFISQSLAESTGGCGWTNTPDQNCGWAKDGSCVTNTLAGAGGDVHYDSNKMPEDLDSCKAACEATANCVAVNYAHPGTGGSGGPGSTSQSSGTCYYRSGTTCGLKCQSGRDCWRLSREDCGDYLTRTKETPDTQSRRAAGRPSGAAS